jgi:hypothetical protein
VAELELAGRFLKFWPIGHADDLLGMQLGVRDHIWTIGELVGAALNGVAPELREPKVGRLTALDGGKS